MVDEKKKPDTVKPTPVKRPNPRSGDYDELIRQIKKLTTVIELQNRRIDSLTTELKMLVSLLKRGVSEVEDEIVDPLFEDIDDPQARQVLKYIVKRLENGRTVVFEKEISKELGIPQSRVGSIMEYLINKGIPIKVVVGDEEKSKS